MTKCHCFCAILTNYDICDIRLVLVWFEAGNDSVKLCVIRSVARIPQGGGRRIRGGEWTLSLKGGGVSFGKNVDLCTIAYGAFGPRGVFGPSRPPPPGYGPGHKVCKR